MRIRDRRRRSQENLFQGRIGRLIECRILELIRHLELLNKNQHLLQLQEHMRRLEQQRLDL